MTHRFPIKEIARQAGVSTATVDRVLHSRASVSPQTRRRVANSIRELEDHEAQLAAHGRRLFIDFVVEAPQRFSRQIRAAIELELPTLQQAVIRPRYTFQEQMSEEQTVAILEKIAARGSQGVCLKARDRPRIHRAMAELVSKNIPVVTMFTDIECPYRIAYAGMNNAKAGETAAYIISKMLRATDGAVLTTISGGFFRGERERAAGFAEALSRRCPDLRLLETSGGGGLNLATAEQVEALIRSTPNIRAVYSMGGGNRAIVNVLDKYGLRPDAFVAHDIDSDNLALLKQEKISFILHDNLRQHVRSACNHILGHHKLAPTGTSQVNSDVQIISPANFDVVFPNKTA